MGGAGSAAADNPQRMQTHIAATIEIFDHDMIWYPQRRAVKITGNRCATLCNAVRAPASIALPIFSTQTAESRSAEFRWWLSFVRATSTRFARACYRTLTRAHARAKRVDVAPQKIKMSHDLTFVP